MAGHTLPGWAMLLAALMFSGATQAADTPAIHLSPSQWKTDGNGGYVCHSASCGVGSVLVYDVVGTLGLIDGPAKGPNFSARAAINLALRYIEKENGFGPFTIASASTRRVRDYIEVTGVGTVVDGAKTLGIALALLTGPGDDVLIVTESGSPASAARNLAEALHSGGY